MPYTVKIDLDEFAESPRDWDNITTLLLAHGRYNLPWETDGRPPASLDELYQVAESLNPVIIRKVYMLDHSGVCFAAGETDPFGHLYYGFDSGMVGLVVITRQDLLDHLGWKRIGPQRTLQLEGVINQDLKIYSAWSNGQVYSYVITDDETGEVAESCGGFYSYDDAQADADTMIERYLEA